MADVESGVSKPEAVNKIVLIRPDSRTVELTGANQAGTYLLGAIRIALEAAMATGLIKGNPFLISSPAATSQSVAEQTPKTPTAVSELTLADLRTPNHFRDYFMYKLGAFLGQNVDLSLPSQEYVDRGGRIKDAGFTTYEPVVFPNLTINQYSAYPANWQFPLDPWIYEQVERKNLKPNVLSLRELWGWLDTSVRLDWKNKDPMFDKNMDQPLSELLFSFRAKGERDGIAVPSYLTHLDPRSVFGVSADETKTALYPALAKIFGVKREEVRDLTAPEFNFVGNISYPHLGGANSWEWLNDGFGVGFQLVGGFRVIGGLSRVRRFPSSNHFDDVRFRPLVVSPFRT